MPNYTYKSKTPKNADSWIDTLRIVSPATAASAQYNEIHFTQPKAALVAALARPHVTFEQGGNVKTHWYLAVSGSRWVVNLGGSNTHRALDGEGAIAQKVADDAVALNFIKPPAAATLIDDDGFATVESKKASKNRVAKSWKG